MAAEDHEDLEVLEDPEDVPHDPSRRSRCPEHLEVLEDPEDPTAAEVN